MSAPAKFLFENDFGRAETRARQAGIAPAVHEAALAQARLDSHAQGVSQGRVEAAQEAEQQTAQALDRVALALAAIARELETLEGRLQGEAVDLAAAIARKLAPALIAREPFAEIAALAEDCFKALVGAPHVVVRVNDALYEEAKTRLGEIAGGCGFAGRLVVLAEPEVARGDCRIEWADGGMVRSRVETEAAIIAAVERYTAARRTPASRLAEE